MPAIAAGASRCRQARQLRSLEAPVARVAGTAELGRTRGTTIQHGQPAMPLVQTLLACGLLDDADAGELVEHANPDVAGLAILASVDGRKPPDAVLEHWRSSPAQGGSKGRRCACTWRRPCSGFRRADAWPLIKALLAHAEDADDHNLPLMYWYALEPLVAADPRQAIAMLPDVKIPLVRQFITRRLVAVHEGDGEPKASNAWVIDELMKLLAAKDRPPRGKAELETLDALRVDVLTGLLEVYRGRQNVTLPLAWPSVREELLVKRSIGLRANWPER